MMDKNITEMLLAALARRLQPLRQRKLRMETAVGYRDSQSTEPLSPFVWLASSPTTGADAGGRAGGASRNLLAAQRARVSRRDARPRAMVEDE